MPPLPTTTGLYIIILTSNIPNVKLIIKETTLREKKNTTIFVVKKKLRVANEADSHFPSYIFFLYAEIETSGAPVENRWTYVTYFV